MSKDIIKRKRLIEIFYNLDDEGNYLTDSKIIYNIPLYQRTYKWDNKLCEMLYHDILSNDVRSEYNFGFVTVASHPKNNYEFDIVDGQQRIITLYLFTVALYNTILSYSDKHDDYKKIHNFVKLNFPFKENNSVSIEVNKIYRTFVLKEKVELEENSNIYRNLMSFVQLINNQNYDFSISEKIASYKNYFDKFSAQHLYMLQYSSKKHALESFISLNMKSKELDTFEVASALLLSIFDDYETEKEYRDKLNKIYSIFINSPFTKFDNFLKSLLWSRESKYVYYCENTNVIDGELSLEMPNHYVQKEIHLPSEGKELIDSLLYISDKFMKVLNGDLDWVLDLIDFEHPQKDMLNNYIKEFSYITNEFTVGKGTLNFFAFVQRYIMYILSKLYYKNERDELTFDFVSKMLRELIFIAIEQHILILLSPSSLIRQDHINTVSAIAIKRFRSEWINNEPITYEELSIEKKYKISRLSLKSITKSKLDTLSLLYQLVCFQKEAAINSKVTILNLSYLERNREHIIIDRSHGENLEYKDSSFINTIYISKIINDNFAELGLKNFIDKSKYVKKHSSTIEKQDFFFYKFVGFFRSSLAKAILEYRNSDDEAMRLIRKYYYQNNKIQKADLRKFEEVNSKINQYCFDLLVQDLKIRLPFFSYTNPNIKEL